MRKKFLLPLLVAVLLSGCGEAPPELSGGLTPYEFTAGNYSKFVVNFPENLYPILATDNYYHTSFNNTVQCTLYTNTQLVGFNYDEDTGLWVSDTSAVKEVDAGQLVFNFPKEYKDELIQYIANGYITEPVVCDMYDSWKLSSMPSYEDVDDLVMLSGNMYNFADAETNKFGGHVAVKWDGSDFLEVFTQDGLLDNLAPEWLSRLMINCGTDEKPKWCKEDSIFYAECGRYCMAAKQLTGNQWYVYFGTMTYRNHMLYACHKVKFSGT